MVPALPRPGRRLQAARAERGRVAGRRPGRGGLRRHEAERPGRRRPVGDAQVLARRAHGLPRQASLRDGGLARGVGLVRGVCVDRSAAAPVGAAPVGASAIGARGGGAFRRAAAAERQGGSGTDYPRERPAHKRNGSYAGHKLSPSRTMTACVAETTSRPGPRRESYPTRHAGRSRWPRSHPHEQLPPPADKDCLPPHPASTQSLTPSSAMATRGSPAPRPCSFHAREVGSRARVHQVVSSQDRSRTIPASFHRSRTATAPRLSGTRIR